ncbi:MAG: 50S ribosomal protein L9 [Coriobacteriales bacterium]|jgi:large subunit ribosomal protein L9|nr:50S ribosomal protein L9 [Coriobacteriales bacterium]
MKVILLQELKGQGGEGDVVDVKRGYAINYLLPQRIAIQATTGNLKQLELRKHNIFQREAARLDSADKIMAALDGKILIVAARVGEEGQLFGSVTTQQIAEHLHEDLGLEVDRKKIDLHAPIKTAGDHTATFSIYRDLKANLTIRVVDEKAIAAALANGQELNMLATEQAVGAEEEAAREIIAQAEEAALEIAAEPEADAEAEAAMEIAATVEAEMVAAKNNAALRQEIAAEAAVVEAEAEAETIVAETDAALKKVANTLTQVADATESESDPEAFADAAASVFREAEIVLDATAATAIEEVNQAAATPTQDNTAADSTEEVGRD